MAVGHRIIPWHERWSAPGRMRRGFRDRFFRFLRQVSSTDDAKTIQAEMLRGMLQWRPRSLLEVGAVPPVYPGLGGIDPERRPSRRPDVIFITGRFRSGSTLLWNIFREIEGCTAYHGPLNERRWFDRGARGGHTDATHRNVTDYWREYEGLEELGDLYRERWIDRDLLMHSDSWDPDLKRYLEVLIDRARGRPVLQFNRVDFRLPWLRSNFPGAKIVHLYRHPRDQWCSTLRQDLPYVAGHRDDPGPAGFGPFYLADWATDLKYHFPFLGPGRAYHPYQTFYFICILSFMYGKSIRMIRSDARAWSPTRAAGWRTSSGAWGSGGTISIASSRWWSPRRPIAGSRSPTTGGSATSRRSARSCWRISWPSPRPEADARSRGPRRGDIGAHEARSRPALTLPPTGRMSAGPSPRARPGPAHTPMRWVPIGP